MNRGESEESGGGGGKRLAKLTPLLLRDGDALGSGNRRERERQSAALAYKR